MAKGSQYERDFCRALSLWWTGGSDDNCFWRTSNSGGRMTVRGRKGKSTASHCGDIAALDDRGRTLVETITLELKRGYSRSTPCDILDKPERGAEQQWGQWFEQARGSAKLAGTPYWAVVARRDRRTSVVWMPQQLWADLQLSFYQNITAMTLRADAKTVCGMRLIDFFEHVTPDKIHGMHHA